MSLFGWIKSAIGLDKIEHDNKPVRPLAADREAAPPPVQPTAVSERVQVEQTESPVEEPRASESAPMDASDGLNEVAAIRVESAVEIGIEAPIEIEQDNKPVRPLEAGRQAAPPVQPTAASEPVQVEQAESQVEEPRASESAPMDAGDGLDEIAAIRVESAVEISIEAPIEVEQESASSIEVAPDRAPFLAIEPEGPPTQKEIDRRRAVVRGFFNDYWSSVDDKPASFAERLDRAESYINERVAAGGEAWRLGPMTRKQLGLPPSKTR